ncbi:MAG TPA: hypothetical protein VIJ14_10515 [Rhabdochlamydiaceae bacterium]
MISIGLSERLECPQEWNDLLGDIFGVNWYGDNLYRVIWGQTDTIRVSKEKGGYEDQVAGGNLAAWLIQRWTPPEKWGTPTAFGIFNIDPANGQLLFPYPEYGLYETVHNLGSAPLDYGIIFSTIPFLEELSYLSQAELRAYKDRQKELENKADVEMITDRLMDALPTRYGPVSYGRGGCRTSVLTKKMDEIQQVWNRIDPRTLPGVGFKQGRI